MTIRTKTIEYAFPQNITNLAAATRLDFAAITLHIPETNARTFLSVVARVYTMDNNTAAAAMTSWLIGIKLGAVAFSDTTVTDTFSNTGEHWGHMLYSGNLAAYFNANFGATSSQTCQVGIQFGGNATINQSVKLIITYQFDDAVAPSTQIKTVRIPIESDVDSQSAVLAEIGTNQVPALDTFLPETGKVYRDIFFEVETFEDNAGASDMQLRLALDAEAGDLDGIHEEQLQTSRLYYRIYRRTGTINTAVDHKFKAESVGGATCFNTLGAILVVTYEYDPSSTTVMNSVVIPVGTPDEYPGGTAPSDQSRIGAKFWVCEPGTITLAQSGVVVTLQESSAMAFKVSCGSQVARAYTVNNGTIAVGGRNIIQRIDSGGDVGFGLGVPLARGENTIGVSFYRTTSVTGSCVSVMLILNYTSGRSAVGAADHASTRYYAFRATAADVSELETSSLAVLDIPETNYLLLGAAIELYMMQTSAAYILAQAELAAGEGPGDGWFQLRSTQQTGSGDLSLYHVFFALSALFKRYPTDPDTARAVVATTRKYRFTMTANSWFGGVALAAYSTITRTVSGQLVGYTGDGSGIPVDIFRADTDEKVGSVTSAVGGSYTFTWYDNAVNLYAVARQTDQLVGRSSDQVAA